MSIPENERSSQPIDGGWEEIRRRAQDPERTWVAACYGRPGTCLFAVALEHRHFPPGSALNDQLDIIVSRWPNRDPLLWTLVSFPTSCLHLAESVAAEFKLALRPVLPHVLRVGRAKVILQTQDPERYRGAGQVVLFPLHPWRPNMRNLEGNDPGAVAYQGPGGLQDALAEEGFLIERELERSYAARGLPFDPDEYRKRIRPGVMAAANLLLTYARKR